MKITSTVLALLIGSCAFAQMKFPAVSSHAEVEQKVGLTEFEIEYNRPNVNGRKVFGKLVLNGEVWRTGANENTVIKFDKPIKVNGQELAAGEYALYSIPNKEEWEVIFYKDTKNWGNPKEWKESNIALKVKAPSTKSMNNKTETFEIRFTNVTQKSANLVLAWDNTTVVLDIETNTINEVLKMIGDQLNENSSAKDFYNSANFYYSNKLDRNQALKWVNTALEKDANAPDYYKELKVNLEKNKY
ncbi:MULTISPECIES: DUF2911 domain-containing protein [Empedobacter]|uniref:DUF2911 domain-containing protein n=1 Tax=Empedobacter falsenii TaxID=343874 RepID=A0A7H9DSC4_9FLAO|nr:MULTISPECIES: DUF2911 domain-containing protein [Empedobacter]MDH2206903.1 DUF2911 domain-containing protein [Empedobacter sp. GD03644]QLL57651.1 DUF2911 domain-containing protein [Empedobacter falsenii]